MRISRTSTGFAFLTAALLLLAAGETRGDRIVLVSGGVLTGEIVSETEDEVVLLVEEGMKMRLDRSRIREIERSRVVEPEPDPPPDAAPAEPEPEPETPPEPSPEDATTPSPEPDAEEDLPLGRRRPRVGIAATLVDPNPASTWRHAASRLPVLKGARTIGFRAYEVVSHEPLSAIFDDPTLRAAVCACGHGGALSSWEFRYVGMRDLRYGDEVKFLAEITSPPGIDPPLIRLVKGPLPHAPRMQLILLRRSHSVKLYATPSVFTVKDFQRRGLDELEHQSQPVRTYRDDLVPIASAWLLEEESGILAEASSPFGETLAVKMDRYRFRVAWFGTPPEKRPALDPALLRRNHTRPLAAPGVPGASAEEIAKHWGEALETRRRLDVLCERALWWFARMGVKPGASYYVERDLVKDHGPLGITLRTLRYRIDADLLDVLAAPLGR